MLAAKERGRNEETWCSFVCRDAAVLSRVTATEAEMSMSMSVCCALAVTVTNCTDRDGIDML